MSKQKEFYECPNDENLLCNSDCAGGSVFRHEKHATTFSLAPALQHASCIAHRASRIVNYASEPAHGCAFDKRVNDV